MNIMNIPKVLPEILLRSMHETALSRVAFGIKLAADAYTLGRIHVFFASLEAATFVPLPIMLAA
jgi:hypothetical protein